MKKWNLIIDVAECTNCNNCFIACKDEYVGNNITGYSASQPLHGHKWINIIKKERGRYPTVDIAYVPTMCNHCDNAPCLEKSNGAVKKRADGIVIIDPDKAKGRKDIVDSCPYRAIWWNEEHELPQTWTFDAHLLDRGWDKPRCVQSCPTGAMQVKKITDQEMNSLAKEQHLQTLAPELDTKPRVYYKNLYLYDKLFIAGEVLADQNGSMDCLANAAVTLYSHENKSGENKLASTRTDEFGEYKIDGLRANLGLCELQVSHDRYPTKSIKLSLDDECVVIDEFHLKTDAQ